MHNSDLWNRYPHIMPVFHEGFEDEIISVQEDGSGEYVAYANLYGFNVIFTQDAYGFISLECVDNETLDHIREIYEESEYHEN